MSSVLPHTFARSEQMMEACRIACHQGSHDGAIEYLQAQKTPDFELRKGERDFEERLAAEKVRLAAKAQAASSKAGTIVMR